MRGRPPIYSTPEERKEARRKASQKYRAKQALKLEEALEKIEVLEYECDVLRRRNGGGMHYRGDVGTQSENPDSDSGSDIPDSASDNGGA
jgi:hypothetical protein